MELLWKWMSAKIMGRLFFFTNIKCYLKFYLVKRELQSSDLELSSGYNQFHELGYSTTCLWDKNKRLPRFYIPKTNLISANRQFVLKIVCLQKKMFSFKGKEIKIDCDPLIEQSVIFSIMKALFLPNNNARGIFLLNINETNNKSKEQFLQDKPVWGT